MQFSSPRPQTKFQAEPFSAAPSASIFWAALSLFMMGPASAVCRGSGCWLTGTWTSRDGTRWSAGTWTSAAPGRSPRSPIRSLRCRALRPRRADSGSGSKPIGGPQPTSGFRRPGSAGDGR